MAWLNVALESTYQSRPPFPGGCGLFNSCSGGLSAHDRCASIWSQRGCRGSLVLSVVSSFVAILSAGAGAFCSSAAVSATGAACRRRRAEGCYEGNADSAGEELSDASCTGTERQVAEVYADARHSADSR